MQTTSLPFVHFEWTLVRKRRSECVYTYDLFSFDGFGYQKNNITNNKTRTSIDPLFLAYFCDFFFLLFFWCFRIPHWHLTTSQRNRKISLWTLNIEDQTHTHTMGFGLILLLILYIIWDVNYFIRCVFTVAMGRLFQSKRKVSDTTTIYGNWFLYHFFSCTFANALTAGHQFRC